MRMFSICRNCAEVHPAEMECPACHPLAHTAARTPPARTRRRERDLAAPIPAVEPSPQRRLVRASTVLVSLYVTAVVLLLLVVAAQA